MRQHRLERGLGLGSWWRGVPSILADKKSSSPYVSCQKCQTMPETIRSVKIWGRGSSLNCQKVFWALCVAPATPLAITQSTSHGWPLQGGVRPGL